MEHGTGLPYIEPSYGKHAHPMDRDRARQDAVTYLTSGRRIHPGPGKHRDNPYAHIRYHVTEQAA